jgi:hypothetical protein
MACQLYGPTFCRCLSYADAVVSYCGPPITPGRHPSSGLRVAVAAEAGALFARVTRKPGTQIGFGMGGPARHWPHWSSSRDFWLAVVAILGTTISPYLFFWQAAQGWRT